MNGGTRMTYPVLGFMIDATQCRTLKSSLKILKNLCQHSEQACAKTDENFEGKTLQDSQFLMEIQVKKCIFQHYRHQQLLYQVQKKHRADLSSQTWEHKVFSSLHSIYPCLEDEAFPKGDSL